MKPRYQVYLYPNKNHGYGKRGGRWFVSYETRRTDNSKPRREIEWLKVETEEQAKSERDRRYTELLLYGAKYKGQGKENRKLVKPKKKEVHPDEYLCKQFVKQVYWTVKIGKEYIGGSRSKVEARKIRDKYLKGKTDATLKPCPECGKTPVFSSNHRTLKHEGDCPLAFTMAIRDVSKFAKITLWNRRIRRGQFKGKKKIYYSDIEEYL